MAYAIMRFEKLKAAGIGSLAGSLAHTFRSRYTPNADPERVKDNRTWLGPETPQGVSEAIRERWPDKYRKDAVGCLEFFIGASPEWFEKHGGDGDQEAYFQGAIDWLKAEFGEENVVSVVQHNDETTPHLAAYVVPLDEYGKLNAKRYTGGRQRCSAMQTSFHRVAGEPVGLERGRKGSTADHMSIRRWYAEHANLDDRARDLRFDVADVGAREVEIAEDLEELDARQQRLDRRERDQQRREYELDDQQSALAQRQAEIDKAGQALAEREGALEVRSGRLDSRECAVSERESALTERGHRLAALEKQLQVRGERLSVGEAALIQRQAEIDRAGKVLQERLVVARQRQQEWESRRDTWLSEHRPPAVPEVVRHLQHLDGLTPLAAAEYLDEQDSVELYALFTPQDGLTPRGKELMSQHGDAAEQRQRWERKMEPPSGPSGPGR